MDTINNVGVMSSEIRKKIRKKKKTNRNLS